MSGFPSLLRQNNIPPLEVHRHAGFHTQLSHRTPDLVDQQPNCALSTVPPGGQFGGILCFNVSFLCISVCFCAHRWANSDSGNLSYRQANINLIFSIALLKGRNLLYLEHLHLPSLFPDVLIPKGGKWDSDIHGAMAHWRAGSLCDRSYSLPSISSFSQ